MIKFAFFDLDGTLSVPRYFTNGQFVTGFTDEGWFNHCETMREHAYDYCLPVQPVKRYAEELLNEGARLFVLSLAQTEGERLAKIQFVKTHYDDFFDDIIFVSSNGEKVRVILDMAHKEGAFPSECELVEDTYSNVLKANDNGIKATHISYIIYNL